MQTTRKTNNTAPDYFRQALQKEKQAQDVQRTGRQQQAAFEREPERGPSFDTALGEAVDSITNCNNRPTAALVSLCEQQKQFNERNRIAAANRARESHLRSHQSELSRLNDQAQTLLNEADMLRRKVEIESRREVSQTTTTTMNLALSWRAVLAPVPFRAKVAKTDADGARGSHDFPTRTLLSPFSPCDLFPRQPVRFTFRPHFGEWNAETGGSSAALEGEQPCFA